jgi:hypothetical protein
MVAAVIVSSALTHFLCARDPTALNQGFIVEVNPTSGEEMRRIPYGNFSVWSVACVCNRILRAVRWNGKHNLQFLPASLR